MKQLLKIVVLLSALLAGPAFAQAIEGTWQGKLAVDKSTSLTIQFIFAKKPDGTYSATLSSPDNGAIKNVAASDVKVSGTAVSLQVPSLSGSYAGTLKNGKIEGNWTQQGQAMPLALAPYQKPVMAKADIDRLVGTWHGPLTVPGGKMTFVYRFKANDKGEVTGTLTVPERGNTEAPMSDIEFANDTLTFKLPQANGDFRGTLAANGSLEGFWKQPAPGVPPEGLKVSLRKGDFAPPVYPIENLSNPAMALLAGSWKGSLQPPGAPKALTIIARFETNRNGQFVAYLDSPDQGAKGIPINSATFDNNKLTFKVEAVRGEFAGDVSGGKTIKGNWSQGPNTLPLELTKQ